jgi:hypothetical protein
MNCQIYCWDVDLGMGSTASKTEKETAGTVGASNVEVLTPMILRDRKRKKTTRLKELTEPYQSAARNERT